MPGWCRGGPSTGGLYTTAAGGPDAFTLSVNGQPQPLETDHGYATVHRVWHAGDVVAIHMAMPPQRVTADARVAADRGRVTLMRGPVVYCLESADHGGRVNDLFLPDDAAVTAEDRPDLLGGVTVLHAAGRRVASTAPPRRPGWRPSRSTPTPTAGRCRWRCGCRPRPSGPRGLPLAGR